MLNPLSRQAPPNAEDVFKSRNASSKATEHQLRDTRAVTLRLTSRRSTDLVDHMMDGDSGWSCRGRPRAGVSRDGSVGLQLPGPPPKPHVQLLTDGWGVTCGSTLQREDSASLEDLPRVTGHQRSLPSGCLLHVRVLDSILADVTQTFTADPAVTRLGREGTLHTPS